MRLPSLVLVALITLVACGSKTAAPDAAPVAPPAATTAPAPTAPTAPAPTAPTEPAAADAATPPADPDAAAPTAAEEVAAAPTEPPAPGEPGEPEPEPPPAALPASVAVTGECVEDLGGDTPMGWVDVVDGKVRLCRWSGMVEGPAPQCWSLDVGAKALSKSEIHPELARLAKGGEWQPTWPEGVKVEDDGKKATWCPTKDACHALDVGESGIGQARVSGDRLLVAPRGDLGTEGKPMTALVFDGAGKRVATIPLSDEDQTGCPDVAWAGSSVWVSLGVCAGPGAVGWLADPMTGKRRVWFGGADKESAWSAYGVMPVMVDKEVAAFREQYGNVVVFHDTTTGAVIRKVDLRASQGKDPETGEWRTGDPEEGTMVLIGGTLVVVQGGQARGTIVLVEASTGKVTDVLALQACAQK